MTANWITIITTINGTFGLPVLFLRTIVGTILIWLKKYRFNNY
jgi:hypothetical protein